MAFADVDLTVTGVPEETEAGTPVFVGFEVQNTAVGIDAPTGEVSLVGTTAGPIGFELLSTETLVEGQAGTTLRPMGLGEQTLIAVYSGDDLHMPIVQFLDPLTVTPVNTVVNIDIDSDSPAYGGGTLGVWATVSSTCASDPTDPAATELCNAMNGNPHGELTLLMDGEPVGTMPIEGTDLVGLPTWIDLDTDLTAADPSGVVRFDVDVPDRALGTPDYYSFTAEFTPLNWFTAASDVVAVETQAAATTTEVVVGDLTNPTRTVNVGETLEVSAFIAADPYWSGPLDGVVNLWVNGNLAAEGLEFSEDLPVVTENIVIGEAGDYSLVAEYVPRSLNHTGSHSVAFTFTAAGVTPDDGGNDDNGDNGDNGGSEGDDTADANGGGTGKDQSPTAAKGQLAHTGSDGAPLAAGLGAVLALGAGILLVIAQRRRLKDTETQ